jgi:uncharacterized protein (DUF305 family)
MRFSKEEYIVSKSAAALLLAVSLVAACGSGSESAASLDQQYIDMMVPHHESAVAMAELAMERSQRSELQEFAAEIIAVQSTEIAQLRTWRMEWFGSEETPPMSAMPMLQGMSMDMPGHDMHGATMDMEQDIRNLESASDFDRAFLEAMIVHHEMAVEASEIVVAGEVRAEIKTLAEGVIADQRAEIQQMEAWLASW